MFKNKESMLQDALNEIETDQLVSTKTKPYPRPSQDFASASMNIK